MRPIRKTFPASLLIEGQTVLVVGGGRVGLRKIRSLLEAGAHVRLVCPEALEEFRSLPVEHVARCFEAGDVAGCRLVVACTDDKVVNRAVLDAARAAGVWCCCADGHWAEGDFIVPATLRTEDLTITVSTNGQSCRTAKEVKDSLVRSLAKCSSGQLYILAVDRAIPLPPRELLSQRLSFLNGLYGWAFLTTCNRTELIAWAAPELVASGLLEHAMHLPQDAVAYHKEAAMKHLTMVLAGMRAAMIGEFHIVGQVRDAFDEARLNGWAHGPLQRVYAEVLRRASVVRAAVDAHLPKIEVEELALEGATGRIVVAGTGRLAQATVQKARERGLDVEVLYHRKPLADVPCAPLESWRQVVTGAERFITCLSVETPYFRADELPVPTYDLGAPRNVEGDRGVLTLNDLRGAYLERLGCIQTLHAIAEEAYEETLKHD